MLTRFFLAPAVVALLGVQLTAATAMGAGDTKPPSLWLAFVDGASRAIDGEWKGGHIRMLGPATPSANVLVSRDLIYANAWRGITARISQARSGLKYSFEVTAGADPRTIHLRYSGIDSIELTDAGELEIAAGRTMIVHLRPVAHQDVHGRQVPVAVRFVPFGLDVAFTVGRYDRSRPLLIESITKS